MPVYVSMCVLVHMCLCLYVCVEERKGRHACACVIKYTANAYYNGRYAMPKKKKRRKKKGKADLTTVLHVRELPQLHMKLAVWFSFPTTNNKKPMIPS